MYAVVKLCYRIVIVSYKFNMFASRVTLRYVYVWGRAMNMAACGVGGYRQILETAEYPTRWKEKTLQAGLVRSHIE